MKKINKVILLLLLICLLFILSPCFSDNKKNDDRDEFLTFLLNIEDKNVRMEFLEKKKEFITKKLAEKFLENSFYHPWMSYSSLTFREAQERYDIAMKMAEILSDNELKGIVMLYKGTSVIDNPEDGQFYYDKGLEYFRQAHSLIGEAWAYRACVQHLYYNEDKIASNLEKAVEIYHRLGIKNEEAYCLVRLKDAYYRLGKKEHALKAGQKAFEIYVSIYKNMNCKYGEYRLYEYEKLIKDFSHTYEEGYIHYEKEMEIISQFTDEDVKYFNEEKSLSWPRYTLPKRDKSLLMASCYESLALHSENWRKYEKAIINYKKCLNIIDVSIENSSCKTEFYESYLIWKVMIYCRLANIYAILGKKQEALKYYEDSVEITEKTGGPKDLISLYQQAGETFILADMIEEGIEKFTACFNILSKTDTTPDWSNGKKAQILYDLSLCYFMKKEYNKSENYLKDSINTESATGKPWYDPMYKLMAEVYLAQGNPNRAFEYKLNHMSNRDKVCDFLFLSRASRDMKNYKKSLEYAKKAMKYIKKDRICWTYGIFAFSTPTWKRYLDIGRVLEDLNKRDDAFEAYKSSVELIETVFNDLKIEGYERDFMKDKVEVYERLINLLLEKGDKIKAFDYNERARARAFLQLISNNRIDIHQGASPELIKKIDELEGDIHFSSDEGKLQELKKEYEKILEELKLKSPEYASLKTAFPLSLKSIQKFLDENTAVIEYFSSEDNLILWVITKDNLYTQNIPLTSMELKNKIEFYRKNIALNMTGEKIKSNEWKDSSSLLYRLLIGDAEKFFKDKTRLVIVPHRYLHYLPFNSLLSPGGQYLIEKYEIIYLPSVSVLSYCKNKKNKKKEHILAFEYGNLKRPEYSPLPDSITEVNSIKKLYPYCEVYCEKDMTKNTVMSRAEHGDIIHFATHGVLDPQSPMFSKLALAEEDLEIYEVFDMKLSAYLVTLSACNTGLGEISHGDELVGFSRAFIYAGTPSVCVSLWNVSDKATADLMERFYFYLKKNSKGKALRYAELDMIKKYHHPFFWAPFILIGDWN